MRDELSAALMTTLQCTQVWAFNKLESQLNTGAVLVY
jgi:hypothetical protein